jgi:endonuclease/exonuclease/phosphatase family metal-dependent hydrolase
MLERSKNRAQTKRDPGPPGWGLGMGLTSSCKKNFVQKPNNQPRISGTYGRRTKRRIRDDIVMATWNVRTMLQPGKMQEIAQEMIRNKIDIMALQEIRWQGTGRIDKPEFTIIYSGSQKRTGQLGTGFIIARKRKESMLEYETINERVCRLRMKGRYRNITIISVHAPTEEKEDREKEEFYECLEEMYHKIQKYDLVIIMGDFNAKIGKEEYQKEVAGKYTIHDISNENGNLLGQFATRNEIEDKKHGFSA